jgi:hypothetical protein
MTVVSLDQRIQWLSATKFSNIFLSRIEQLVVTYDNEKFIHWMNHLQPSSAELDAIITT